MRADPLAAFRRKDGALPLIFGHRGVRGPRPENTLGAFGLAADEGADGVELDVRLCASGEVIVLHDADLARVTDGRDARFAGETRFADLARVDLDGEKIPLLEDVLALSHQRGLLVNVELKHDEPRKRELVLAVRAALTRSPLPPARVVLSSFHPKLLLWARGLVPHVGRAFICHYGQRRSHPFGWAVSVGSHAVHPEWSLLDTAHRSWVKRHGLVLGAWTVNDEAVARTLSLAGLDSLITDRPGAMRRALA